MVSIVILSSGQSDGASAFAAGNQKRQNNTPHASITRKLLQDPDANLNDLMKKVNVTPLGLLNYTIKATDFALGRKNIELAETLHAISSDLSYTYCLNSADKLNTQLNVIEAHQKALGHDVLH